MSGRKAYAYLFLLTALAVPSFAHGAAECSVCGSSISGKYYVSSRQQVICPDCNSRYPACSGCGLVSNSGMPVDGISFCRECYLKLPLCGICGKKITGGYNRYPDLGIDVCFDCERTSSRCDNCNSPSKNLMVVGQSSLCQLCAAKTARCRSCGNALLSEFKYFEGNEAFKYCSDCASAYPACADCGAPSGSRGSLLDDNRHLCPDCAAAALFDPALVTPIKNSVLGFMANNLGMFVRHEITYALKGKDFLEVKSEHTHGDLNGLFYRRGDEYNIYVLYGLREKDLIWVIAHEITHAWQAENTSGNLKPDDREGFAQWTAYEALRFFGYGTFAETLTNGNTSYSRGLRRMLEIEKSYGPTAVIKYINSQ